MRVVKINVSTDGSGNYTTSDALASGKRFVGWYVDINGLATSTTTDFTWTDGTGRTLDSAANVTADGMYVPLESDTGGGAGTTSPLINGALTLTVAQGGATVTNGVVWAWVE